MDIALLNKRILFQRSAVVKDAIGNHMSVWEDYYECACTVGGESGREVEAAGMTVEHTDISFTVRASVAAEGIRSEKYRILFKGSAYDIVSIDHMNYKGRCIKFRCRRIKDENSIGG